MKATIKKIVRGLIPSAIKNIINEPYMIELNETRMQSYCFAQEGEDLILETFFSGQQKGFYVDIGAYDPILYSNTYLFYKKGWKGLNIDARPGSKALFDAIRVNDINVESGIGISNEPLTYYKFDEPGLNGFSKKISEDRNKNTKYKIIETIKLPINTLSNVLDNTISPDQNIDFMSIDVEGLDYEVLLSNNWDKYKPLMILIETSVIDNEFENSSPIHNFLIEKEYTLVAKTYRTSFYKLKK